jgi:ABC-type transport system involved in cytochrome c biogenesis permease subunit
MWMTAILVALTAAAPANEQAGSKPRIPAALDLTALRAIPVQHDGRWMPLDTLARDLVESVTGEVYWQGHDPVAVLLAWSFDSAAWMRQPLIPIANAELREKLQLPVAETSFSYDTLLNHQPLREIMNRASANQGRKLDPLESKVNDIEHKLVLLDDVFAGEAIRMVPDPKDPLGRWEPIKLTLKEAAGPKGSLEAIWAAVATAFLKDDPRAFTSAVAELRTALSALPAAYTPPPRLIATELRYNSLHPLRIAWIVMLIGAILGLAAMFVRRRVLDVITTLALVAGFAVLSYDLWLRWQIAGRIPAANMFESLLFLGWGTGAFTILSMLVFHYRIVPLTASVISAVSLILADCLPLDHYIRPVAPVLLDTVWMSIHVPIIMIAYAVLALAFLIAHVQLGMMAAVPSRRDLTNAVDLLHYRYIHVGAFLLLIGIVTGSMWAASSWGRYWGWDPKEVWSLIAFLAYLTILHVRVSRERVPQWAYWTAVVLAIALFVIVVPKLAPLTGLKVLALVSAAVTMVIFALARGPMATALKSILGFWLIIMTYVGVNYVLGIGLHSYGFGTGAVVHYLFLFGSIDLVLVLLCAAVYAARSGAPSMLR